MMTAAAVTSTTIETASMKSAAMACAAGAGINMRHAVSGRVGVRCAAVGSGMMRMARLRRMQWV